MASASSANNAGTSVNGVLHLAAPRDDPEFEILHDAASQALCEICQNLPPQREQIALPDAVFHFHDEAGPHHADGAGVRSDLLADGFGPCGQCQLPRR